MYYGYVLSFFYQDIYSEAQNIMVIEKRYKSGLHTLFSLAKSEL